MPPVTEPVIVLDPGHGGADGGAHGVGGVLEKTLVLAFCVELKRQLEATKRYAIVMTREDDQYVDLDDRVTIAREANASLFVSVHADILSEAADVSGSTVYTVADRASDAEAARIAARENAADPAPGKVRSAQDDPEVADILFDLKRRETRAYAHIFSRGLVDGLRGVTRLNHNPERSAGFVVLKAPEFPSVLVELGYLSNPQDVQAMTSADWRANDSSGDGQGDRCVLRRLRRDGRRCRERAGRRSSRPADESAAPVTLAETSSLSDLNVKSLISLEFVFLARKIKLNDINMLSVKRTSSPTDC